MEKLRIVFMEHQNLPSAFWIIIKNNYTVVRVITADKPAGRGQKLKYSAVKEYALAQFKTIQPTNLKRNRS
jgi:methionyl-tRNA formyltransferase